MNDSIEQFEMHMCCGSTSIEKKQNLLKLREVVDAEIAKIAKIAEIPPPPPLPSHLLASSAMQKGT